jgi:hypothetical protein
MAEAIKIEQFNIHTYLIFLYLCPIAIKLLCHHIVRSTHDKTIQQWKETLVKEERLDAYDLRGPRPGRRHCPPPHWNRPPQSNPRRNSQRGFHRNSGQTVAGGFTQNLGGFIDQEVVGQGYLPRGITGVAITP